VRIPRFIFYINLFDIVGAVGVIEVFNLLQLEEHSDAIGHFLDGIINTIRQGIGGRAVFKVEA
jgi:hypothetical protein